MISCGGAVRWCRDVLFPDGYDAMNREADAAGLGAGGALFAPYLSGERCPHVDPFVRGGFLGLSLSQSRGDLAKAVFEGVTFGLKDCLELMNPGKRPNKVRVTGGGAKSQLWVQMLADVLGCPCQSLISDEGPAYGAAILGGLSAGVWSDLVKATEQAVRVRDEVKPSGLDYSGGYLAYRGLYPRLSDLKDSR